MAGDNGDGWAGHFGPKLSALTRCFHYLALLHRDAILKVSDSGYALAWCHSRMVMTPPADLIVRRYDRPDAHGHVAVVAQR